MMPKTQAGSENIEAGRMHPCRGRLRQALAPCRKAKRPMKDHCRNTGTAEIEISICAGGGCFLALPRRRGPGEQSGVNSSADEPIDRRRCGSMRQDMIQADQAWPAERRETHRHAREMARIAGLGCNNLEIRINRNFLPRLRICVLHTDSGRVETGY